MVTSGQRIGEYVLDEPVGAGTFGQVWRARHHVWADRVVAVKIPTDPRFVRTLQREAAAVHGLAHANIVRPVGFDPYADPPYLVSEYVPGESLRFLLDRRRLAAPEAVAILRQVLAGLAYAHRQGMAHLDIKPENVLIHERAWRDGLDAEGVVKVTDFGLGRAAREASGAAGPAASILHSASLAADDADRIVGTLDYMAPEQRRGSAGVDGRADLYACGVVLYEMLTGERPAGLGLPSDLNPAVSPHLDAAFRRAYARVDRRFPSAEAFAAALDDTSADVAAPAGGRPAPATVSSDELLAAAVERATDLQARLAKFRPADGKRTPSQRLAIAAMTLAGVALLAAVVVGLSPGVARGPGMWLPAGVYAVIAAGLGVGSAVARRHERRQVADAEAKLAEHLRRIEAGFPGATQAWAAPGAITRPPESSAATAAPPPPAAGPRALFPSVLEELAEGKAALERARTSRLGAYVPLGILTGVAAIGFLVCSVLMAIDLTAGLTARPGAVAVPGLVIPVAITGGLLPAFAGVLWLVVRHHRRAVARAGQNVADLKRAALSAAPASVS